MIDKFKDQLMSVCLFIYPHSPQSLSSEPSAQSGRRLHREPTSIHALASLHRNSVFGSQVKGSEWTGLGKEVERSMNR